jgi:hypothetical protein
MSETDVDLIFAHMLHSEKMAKLECEINGQKVSMIKLGMYRPVEISMKEKAKFILEQSIRQIEQKMD